MRAICFLAVLLMPASVHAGELWRFQAQTKAGTVTTIDSLTTAQCDAARDKALGLAPGIKLPARRAAMQMLRLANREDRECRSLSHGVCIRAFPAQTAATIIGAACVPMIPPSGRP